MAPIVTISISSRKTDTPSVRRALVLSGERESPSNVIDMVISDSDVVVSRLPVVVKWNDSTAAIASTDMASISAASGGGPACDSGVGVWLTGTGVEVDVGVGVGGLGVGVDVGVGVGGMGVGLGVGVGTGVGVDVGVGSGVGVG